MWWRRLACDRMVRRWWRYWSTQTKRGRCNPPGFRLPVLPLGRVRPGPQRFAHRWIGPTAWSLCITATNVRTFPFAGAACCWQQRRRGRSRPPDQPAGSSRPTAGSGPASWQVQGRTAPAPPPESPSLTARLSRLSTRSLNGATDKPFVLRHGPYSPW